jgi:pilus assembly protein CpaE
MAKILIVEDTADTRNLIRVKLTKAGHEVVTAEDGEAALSLAFTLRPQVIVLDVMLPKLDGFTVARRLRQNALTRNVGILMLTAKGEIADKVSGYEAGTDDYLTKPFDPSELELRIRTLLSRVGMAQGVDTSSQSGQLISVFSMRGGVGKTTLAVNLAVTLGQLWGKPVALMDLALQNGLAALFLSARPKASLYNFIREWKEYRDVESMSEFFTRADNNVHLLAAPRHPSDADRVSPDMLKHLVNLVHRGYGQAVVDLPSQWNDQTLAVLDASDLVLALMTPEVASVQTMTETLDTFSRLEYPKDKVRIVVNNTFARRALAPAQIESALGLAPTLQIPHDPELFVHAVNTGQPYVLLNPGGAATRAIQDFAWKNSRVEMDGVELSPLAKAAQARVKKG